jgi:hypothetical protein
VFARKIVNFDPPFANVPIEALSKIGGPNEGENVGVSEGDGNGVEVGPPDGPGEGIGVEKKLIFVGNVIWLEVWNEA